MNLESYPSALCAEGNTSKKKDKLPLGDMRYVICRIGYQLS